jgi:DNA-binding transcriptional ArsR family regulator
MSFDRLPGPQRGHRDFASELQQLDRTFAALSHPARRQVLLALLFRGTMTAGEIARRFEHTWPTTVRHVNVLERAELVSVEAVGRERRHSLRIAPLLLCHEWLGWFGKEQDGGDPLT